MKIRTPHAINATLLALLLTVGVTACSESDTPSSSVGTDQGDLETDADSSEPAGDVDSGTEGDPVAETDSTADSDSSDS